MGWCKELISCEKYKHLDKERHYQLVEEMAEMVDRLYEIEASKWEAHREKAESAVLGWHFSKEGAERAVAAMQNADGTTGQYWSLSDVEEVVKTMNIDLSTRRYNIYDIYYTLNMMRSDYYEADKAPQEYVKRTFQFLDDKDAPEGMAKRYWYAKTCL